MKKIITLTAIALMSISSAMAQTMTLTIEGKEVKNGDEVIVEKTFEDMTQWAIPNVLKVYDLNADVELRNNISQTVELTGQDLDKDHTNHLACCPPPFNCSTANEDNGFISSCTMTNLTPGQVVKSNKFIHYAYSKEPTEPFTRTAKIKLQGAQETIEFTLIFRVSETNGISSINADEKDVPTYNMAGQKVNGNAAKNTILIRNGRKFIK